MCVITQTLTRLGHRKSYFLMETVCTWTSCNCAWQSDTIGFVHRHQTRGCHPKMSSSMKWNSPSLWQTAETGLFLLAQSHRSWVPSLSHMMPWLRPDHDKVNFWVSWLCRKNEERKPRDDWSSHRRQWLVGSLAHSKYQTQRWYLWVWINLTFG
jgi:hypothetical protein